MVFTAPPNNLGPYSQPWGDWISQQVVQNATQIERLGGDSTNDGVQNNSALDQIANQIQELQARQSGLVIVPDASLNVPGNGGTSSITIPVQVPRPADAPRIGWLSVQFTAAATTSDSTEIFGSFSLDGNVFHRDSRYVPTENLEPPSWNGNKALTGYTGFVAAPTSGGDLSIVVEGISSFGASSRLINLSNIRVTYQYGQVST